MMKKFKAKKRYRNQFRQKDIHLHDCIDSIYKADSNWSCKCKMHACGYCSIMECSLTGYANGTCKMQRRREKVQTRCYTQACICAAAVVVNVFTLLFSNPEQSQCIHT
jgi:hypothetical protein